MPEILQSSLPTAPWADPRLRRLPGIQPLDITDWLRVDDAYTGQMALRDTLIAERRDEVHALLPEAEAAAAELYARVLADLPGLGFRCGAETALRPDGVEVALDPAQPLVTLGRLVQEDFCIMQPDGAGEHMLTGAILCFPAGWRLDEKIGRAMVRIHVPIAYYTEDIARRVQRLFDGIRDGAPMWRQNAHLSAAPLFNPRSEAEGKDLRKGALPWIRSERQCLLKLPQSGAVIFSIHTYRIARESLTPEQEAALAEHPIHQGS